MSYKVVAIPPFERQLKRLARKYPSMRDDVSALVELLVEQPTLGTPIGKNCYKIRLAISSKATGKSGGARVITTCIVSADAVYLLAVYDKSERANITELEIDRLLGGI